MSDTQPVDLQPTSDATTERTAFDPSVAMRWLLAALSFGAGVIHLVMVPQHAQESVRMGVAFAVAGWFQIAFGAAILAKPTRTWLQVGIVANAVFIATWALSRTAGLPEFTGSTHVDPTSSVDALTVAFEGALIVGAIAVLAAPNLLKNLKQPALVAGAIIPAAVLIATTAVLASPDTANHAHGGDTNLAAGGHSHSTDHAGHTPGMDMSQHPAGQPAADGHTDHAHGDQATATPAASRCDWDLNTAAFWKKNPAAEDHHEGGSHDDHEKAKAESGAGEGQGNGHGAQAWTPLADKAKCDKLKADIDAMEAVAKKYPTAQDALNAGCFRVTIYVPGIAAHYMCPKNFSNTPTIEKPEMILYGGSQPWAPVVGLSYYSLAKENPKDSSNDLWVQYMPRHFHEGLCIKGTLVIGGDNSSKEKCEANGGKVQGRTGWMGHYWMDTCSSPDGVFSADNPRLDISVANVNDDPANAADPSKLQADPCAGSKMDNGPDDTFGPPSTVNTKQGETAAPK